MLDLSENQQNFATFDLVKYRVNEKVLSCWVVIWIQFYLPLHQHTFGPRRRVFFSTRIALVFVRSKWTKWNQPDLYVLLASSKGRMSWGRWWNQLIGDLYRFFYHGDQMISWWRIWLSTSKSTCVVPAWPRRMLLLGSVPADDRSNWPLTPRVVHLFKMYCKLRLAWVYLWKPFRCQPEGRVSIYFTRTAR